MATSAQYIVKGGSYAVWATGSQIGQTLQIYDEGGAGTGLAFATPITFAAAPTLVDLPGDIWVNSSSPATAGTIHIKGSD